MKNIPHLEYDYFTNNLSLFGYILTVARNMFCGAKLIEDCLSTPKLIVESKPGECPDVPEGTVGICVQECDSDSGCPDNKKCCSNGCGNVCTDPVSDSGQS